MSEKWYFIIFQHQYISKTTGASQEWYDDEAITQKHPVDFLVDYRLNHAENDHARHKYRLLFWAEIPETVALRNKVKFE